MGNKELFFLPSYLQQFGYSDIECIKKLSDAIIEHAEYIEENALWKEWRGIFEYLSCVEFAYCTIMTFPKGSEIGSHIIVPARYHTAALVFFAQAAMDNVSMWLDKNLLVEFNDKTKRSLHKKIFQDALIQTNLLFIDLFKKHSNFLKTLNDYRNEWIHRLIGGAFIGSDKNPGDPDANVQIVVPIDPECNMFNPNPQNYLKRIEECRQKNNEKWLYSIDEFAEQIKNGTKDLILDLLEISLKIFK
jgi:hypothetical protein